MRPIRKYGRLQVGPGGREAYKMVWDSISLNYNGTIPNSWIVMVDLRTWKIVMARNELTHYTNMQEHRRRKIRNLLDSTALVFWDQNENFAYPLLVQEMAPDRQTVHAQACALKIVALVYIRLKYLYIGLRVWCNRFEQAVYFICITVIFG